MYAGLLWIFMDPFVSVNLFVDDCKALVHANDAGQDSGSLNEECYNYLFMLSVRNRYAGALAKWI